MKALAPTTSLLAVLLVSLSLSGAGATERPSDYDAFEVWDPATSDLEDFVIGRTHVLVPVGSHVVDNPIVVDTTAPLFLHGAGRLITVLRAANPSLPLFEIRAAERVGVAALRLEPEPATEPFTAFEFSGGSNNPSFRFEMQDTYIARGGIEIRMPGVYVLQANTIDGARNQTSPEDVQDGVLLDHHDASLYVVGGKHKDVAGANVHQIRGHVEIYGPLFNQPGVADVLIESPSPYGAHFVVGSRTEGSHDPATVAPLVLVPQTGRVVDVVVKANSFASGESADSAFVDFNAAGTLWMLANNSRRTQASGADPRLVEGIAPKATIVALGNVVQHDDCPVDLFPVTAQQILNARNLYDHQPCWADPGVPEEPRRRLWLWPTPPDPQALGAIPEPPQNSLGGAVPLLDMPSMNAVAGGLLDVTWFGAVGDGVNDDTLAIQNALDWSRRVKLYFPAGTYRITEPLTFESGWSCPPPSACPSCPVSCQTPGSRQVGGRIAGAGSGSTTIVNTETTAYPGTGEVVHGQVFDVRSMHSVTIQGLTLRSEVAINDEARGVFHLGDGDSPSTQSNSFYDVVFQGGDFGLGVLLDQNAQGDATFCAGCTFEGSRVGFVNGGGNALNNVIHGGRFVDNEVATMEGIKVDGSTLTRTGGTALILSAETEGTTDQDFVAFGRVFYVNDFSSSAALLSSRGCSSAMQTVLIDNSSLSPAPPVTPWLAHDRAGSFSFLHTATPPGTGAVVESFCGGVMSQTSLLSLFSTIDDWSLAVTKPGISFADEID